MTSVPPTKAERNRFLLAIRKYVAREKPVPPLSLEELFRHTEAVIAETEAPALYRNFLTVLLNNEVWKDTVAGFPYERRLLLLPKCLRSEEECPASFDAFGLLCRGCGRCPIGDLQREAIDLGYVVMVAEGSPVVMSLIETGKVDAVVGVSCLSVLERVFPYMEAGSVPGVAVPLLNEGCKETTVDLDWVWDAIHMLKDDPTPKLDLEGLRSLVRSWFTPAALEEVMGPVGSRTEKIARRWLSKAGKRWRPFLAVCAYQAFGEDPAAEPPAAIRSLAVAIECFHKASLIHDDIEDSDSERYGEKTLHEKYGVPAAINIGDFLIGEGYRLLSYVDAEVAGSVLRVVAEGHRSLCVGQGSELLWHRKRKPLTPAEVLEIFRLKTAPAFEVALRAGALCAGRGEELRGVLHRFAGAIGIAYQIRDDIEDWRNDEETGDLEALRPSLLLALAYERAPGKEKKAISRVLARNLPPAEVRRELAATVGELGAEEAAQELLDHYKGEAIRSLCGLDNGLLKGLLRRVVGRIFNEVEAMGCCVDHQRENASGGEEGTEAVA